MKIQRLLLYLFLLILVVVAVTFAATNAQNVTLHYYVGAANVSLALLLVYSLGIGIFLGFFALLFPWMKLKNENRQLKNRMRQAEKKLQLSNESVPPEVK